MIKLSYANKEIKLELAEISKIVELPIKFCIQSEVSKEIVWSSELQDNWWAAFPNNEINNTLIYDGENNLIFEKKWNVIEDGSFLYQSLYLYCQKLINQNKRPKGVAIGTHDGEFGEWVPVVLENKTDGILVEASLPQFERLKKNYSDFNNVELINSLISSDGGQVEFFEGGLGYTNSIVERVIRNWEKDEIKSSYKDSSSVNELMTKKFDWLHTDVEGYDAKLIMAIDEKNLPPFIIFEHENLPNIEKMDLEVYLKNLGYTLNYQNVSCLAIK